MTAALFGCGAGTSSLNGNLTPSGASVVAFKVTTTTLPDAISNRPYTAGVATNAAQIFTSFGQDKVSQNGNGCVLSGSYPAGLTPTPGSAKPYSPYDCVLSLTAAPAAGTYTFTLTAQDSSSPPAKSAQSFTLTIRNEFSFQPNSLPDGVVTRAYGTGGGCVGGSATCLQTEPTNINSSPAPSTTPSGPGPNGNGPLTSCALAVNGGTLNLQSPTPLNATPANAANTQALIQTPSGAVLTASATGPYTVKVSCTDNAIVDPVAVPPTPAVPANTISTAALPFNVNAEITFALNLDTASGVLPDGVNGRTYGAPAKTSLIFTAQGGLVTTQGLTFSSTGALPAPVACAPLGTSQKPGPTVTLTCNSGNAVLTAAAGAYPLGVAVSDPGNTATPANKISVDTPQGHTTYTLNIDSPLALSVTPAPAPALPFAVDSRPYGTTSTCGASGTVPCQPLVYSMSGGLGSYLSSGYTLPASTPASFPAGFGCAASTVKFPDDTYTCDSANVTATPGPYTPSVTVDDIANATTPDAASSSTVPNGVFSLTVDAALVWTPNAPGDSPPNAVAGRDYGISNGCSSGNCIPLTYTATGPTDTFTIIETATPPGITCTTNGNTTGAVVTCDSGVGAIPANTTPNTYPLTIKVTDNGNVSVPASSIAISKNLTINAVMALALQNGYHDPLPQGVISRAYGTGAGCSGGACVPIVYLATGGIPAPSGYIFTSPPASSAPGGDNIPTGMSCASASPNLTCSAGSIGSTAGVFIPTASVDDTANLSTPDGTSSATAPSVTAHLTVNNPLAMASPTSPLPPGVDGRAYGTGVGCTVGACQAPVYTASGGLGTAPSSYAFSNVATALYPTGISCVFATPKFTCSGTDVTGAAGPYNPKVTLDDTANTATPGSVPTNNTQSSTVSLTIDPALVASFSQNGTLNPVPLLPGIEKRSYGIINGNVADVAYSVTGGFGSGSYLWCLTGTETPPLPAGFQGAPTNICGKTTSTQEDAFALTANPVTSGDSALSPYTGIQAQVGDAGNASVPDSFSSGQSSTTVATSIVIDPPLLASFVQNAISNPATLYPGVEKRSYGVIGAPPTYSAVGGFGSASYLWCQTGTLPGGLTTAPTTSTACALGSSTVEPGFNMTANPSISSGASGASPYLNITAEVDDAGNPAVPDSFSSGQSSVTSATSIVITPPLLASFSQNGVANPPTLLQGIEQRSYGIINLGAGAPMYSVTGGLGAGNYLWCFSSANQGIPAGFGGPGLTCSLAGSTREDTFNFTSNSVPVGDSGSPGPTYTNITAEADDVGNPAVPNSFAAVPPQSSTTSATSITINSALVASFVQNAVPNPTTLLPGVENRNYGITPLQAGAVTYSVLNGFGSGSYLWCLTGAQIPPLPTGFQGLPSHTCGVGTSTLEDSFTLTGYPVAIGDSAGSPYTNIVGQVGDAGNAAVPDSFSSSQTSSTVATQIVITPRLKATFTQNSVVNSTTLLTGVANRSYGIINSGAGAVAYTASGGLGTGKYLWCLTGTLPVGFTGAPSSNCGFSTSTPEDSFTLSANPIATGTAGSYTNIQGRLDDIGNAATPDSVTAGDPGIATTTTLNVRSQLALTPSPYPIPDAVNGRAYGAPLQDLTYTVTAGEGLPPVTLAVTAGGFPAPITACNGPQNNAGDSNVILTCNSAGVGGPVVTGATSAATVTVSDTANAATPAATYGVSGSDPAGQQTDTLTVDKEIVIQNSTTLPNGQLNEPYYVVFSCQDPTLKVCGGTGNPGSAQAEYTWSATSNNVSGVSFITGMPVPQPTGDATFAGTPSAVGTSETVTIGIADTGNSTTPSCTTAVTCPGGTYNATILTTTLFIDATNNKILPVDTSTNSFTEGTPIVPTGGSTPNRLAVSPNGTYLFVADPGANQVDIIDSQAQTVSKIVATTQGLAATGVTDVTVGPQVVPGAGVSPDDVYAYVTIPGSEEVQVIDGNPANGTTYGTVVNTIPLHCTGTCGPSALKITPTILNGGPTLGSRQTRIYVVRPTSDDVCVIDAEPSNAATFLKQIPAAGGGNADGCIALGSSGVTAKFIEITPDGELAFVSKSNGTTGIVDIIATSPDGSQDQITGLVDMSTAVACNVPEHMRSTVDAQTVWVACSDVDKLYPIATRGITNSFFPVGTPFSTPNASGDAPKDIAFIPNGSYGFVTLSGLSFFEPFFMNASPPTAGNPQNTSPLTGPDGIDHIPDPSLHVTTVALPAATNGKYYQSSIVAQGLNQPYTFTDVSAPNPTFASCGITLYPDGFLVAGSVGGTCTGGSTYTFNILVTDASLPVPNQVAATVSLPVN